MIDELACRLALVRTPGVGPVTARRLIDMHGSAQACFRQRPSAAHHPESSDQPHATRPPRDRLHDTSSVPPTRIDPSVVDWAAVERDLTWAQRPDHHILAFDDPRYPPRLAQIDAAPLLLFANGNIDCLGDPQLAVIGSRNPTPSGAETGARFAEHLARSGLVITSGLALGIDAAAHRGALAAGAPTIAVGGTGPDRIYPSTNRALAERIVAERGCIVTEFPTGTPAKGDHFPRRNRIISGLSLGVLVVEATVRSGSLGTARHAADQGREVYAIPGSIHNPMARGCHALIRNGAKLVEQANDVLEELKAVLGEAVLAASTVPASAPNSADPTTRELAAEYVSLLEALDFDPTSIDTLVARSGLTAEAVSSMLLILELDGRVTALPGGLYTRTTQ